MFESLKRKFQLKFKDRTYAASILAAALEDLLAKEEEEERRKESKNDGDKSNNLVVLGIPRGGVIVADIVATKLKASKFDIVIPGKLRIPHNEEAAFGAIMGDGTVYLEDRIVRDLDISEEYIEKEKHLQMLEIQRRFALYRKQELQQQPLESKTNKNTITILVDDGAASGATVIAAAIHSLVKYDTNQLMKKYFF